jgi:phosphoglycolate phosphatase-like HAD superfamily hydrolase
MADASVLADDWVAEIESPDWLARDELVPDAVAALRYLASRGTRAVILTARRSRSGVVQQLDRLGITSLIDSVIVVPPADVVRKKALYLRRLSAEGFVGDTEADARAAALAGVKFVAVSGGQRSAAFLIRAGVPLVCRDLMSALRRLSL